MKYVFVNHELNKDFWESKRALFEAFYGAFYDFIKSHGGEEDLASHNIKSKQDFYDFADFFAGGMKDCYAMGFAFHKYYLKARMNGSYETEPEDTFIGYCLKNGLFTDFLNFLISFFAYWRNDEGCTCMDPYNYADNLFVSSWAALVDTTKLFYFTSETVYHWHSFRIKYVLDHIPGTFLSPLPKTGLPVLRVSGYKFDGWFDGESNDAKPLTDEKAEVAYAHFTRMDTYNYWEKEEKTIKKVYIEDWKKVDPA